MVLDNVLGHKPANKPPVVIESMGSPSTNSVKMTSLDDLMNESISSKSDDSHDDWQPEKRANPKIAENNDKHKN